MCILLLLFLSVGILYDIMLLLWEGGEVLSVNKLNKNVEMASEYDKNNKNKQTNKQTNKQYHMPIFNLKNTRCK